jgi:hypothetical protein
MALVSFGTSAFRDLRSQFSSLFVSPRMVLPRVHDLMTCVLPQIDGSGCFGCSGFGDFKLFSFTFSQSASTGVHDLSPHALLDLRSRFSSAFWLFGFGASGVCLTPHLETSEVVFPEVFDLSTRISCRPMDKIYFGSFGFSGVSSFYALISF